MIVVICHFLLSLLGNEVGGKYNMHDVILFYVFLWRPSLNVLSTFLSCLILEMPGALAHRLKHRTIRNIAPPATLHCCKIQNCHQGSPKLRTGFG